MDVVVIVAAHNEGERLPATLGALDEALSGQRARRGDVLDVVAPFVPRVGMETAMNIDAARAVFRVAEVPLVLEHRATGRTIRGFAHRARQLADFVAVALARR